MNNVVVSTMEAQRFVGSTVDIEISNVNTSGTYDMYLNNVLVQMTCHLSTVVTALRRH
jgi:hypothetical protein